MSDQPDEGVVRSFKFSSYTAEEMQRWIDVGYFESDADLAFNAFQILFHVMREIEKDKKIIDFHSVTIEIGIDVPMQAGKYVLQ